MKREWRACLKRTRWASSRLRGRCPVRRGKFLWTGFSTTPLKNVYCIVGCHVQHSRRGIIWRWRVPRGSTNLQPLALSVRSVNISIVNFVHSTPVIFGRKFCRYPAQGLGNCSPLIYRGSKLILLYQDLPWRGALGHLVANPGPGLRFVYMHAVVHLVRI